MKQPYTAPTITRNVNGFFDKHGHSGDGPVCEAIEGAQVNELVKKFGSPLFVYSEKKLRRQVRDAKRAFGTRYPNVQFAWSYKTNYLAAICQIFHEEGSLAEVVSDFEYEKARANGVEGKDIILNGPCKPRELLLRAAQEGAKIQLDNYQEIKLLEDIASELGKTIDVAIRVNMEVGSSPTWSKFGFNFESGDAMSAIQTICRGDRLRLVGLHSHIGTFILEPSDYTVAMRKLLSLYADARNQFGLELTYINAGGGFASRNTLHQQYLPGEETTPSYDEYADAICHVLMEELPANTALPKLYLETGRAFCDEAGYLISSVIDSRRDGSGGRAIIADAGVNLLYTAAWYKFDVRAAQACEGPYAPTTVYGPLCMNIDVVRKDASLPPLAPNDKIVIHPVGAYNLTQSMQFIMYRPAVILIGVDGEIDLIRERETLEHVESLERMPKRLQREGLKTSRELNH